ncbi:MAG: type II toxin-antitoxin system VapC family toxin [bacterium]
MILLDTCVISETLKPEPSESVLAWIGELSESQVYIPALVLGELHKGVHLLADGSKRDALRMWLDQLEERFHGRILAFDHTASIAWGRLSADLKRRGVSVPAVDLMLAALAICHSAVFATRNSVHFSPTGVDLVNPWEHPL